MSDGVIVSELTVEKIKKSQEGSYTCVGSNGVANNVGFIDRGSATVTVQGQQ